MERDLNPKELEGGGEMKVEQSLRPQVLDEYIGQNAVREKITSRPAR